MKVRFYHFAKRNKETKVPTNESYTDLDVYLKDGCDVTKPVLLIQTTVAPAFNYVFIPDFKRYYFISEGRFTEGMYEVSLTEDYLGSYKSAIGSTIANVLYASGSTKSIVDSRIPVKSNILMDHNFTAIDNLTINTGGTGAVIIGITGKGSFGAYLLQYNADIVDLLDGTDDYWNDLGISNAWDALKQSWYGGSAAECLKSAISLPIVLGGSDVSGGSAEDLYLGGYPCKRSGGANIKGYHITKPVITRTTTISIPWISNDWKRVAQYSDITVFVPMCGFFTIPATEAQDDTSLDVKMCINVTSGDIAIAITGTQSGKKFALGSGNCAMNTPFGSTGIDTNKMMQGAITGVGAAIAAGVGLATGGLSTAAQLAIGASIATSAKLSLDAMGGTGAGSAGLGGGASHCIDQVIHVWVTQKELTDTQANFNPLIGKPYMGVAAINTFSGYVQTDGFQFSNDQAYSSEKDIINQLLDTGIYYT